MKLRSTIVVISCVALIFVGLIIWHFVHAGRTVRWLAREAIAHRIRAEQGDAESQFKLGSMNEARESRRTMARPFAGTANPPSRVPRRPNTGLGFLYYRGEGVPQDYAEAARWYRKSAEQGDGNAQYFLGYMYYYGYGVAQDKGEANRLFHQAAAQGNEDARRAIGWNKAHVPALSRIVLPLKCLASFCGHEKSAR